MEKTSRAVAFTVIGAFLLAGGTLLFFLRGRQIDPSVRFNNTTSLRDSDYSFLEDIALHSRIISIGESTHGSREFNRIRMNAFKELVKYKYTVFFIEGDFGKFLPVSRYVDTGEGDLSELLSTTGYWIWDNKELYDMVQWMRAYNARPGNRTKLKLLGVDAKYNKSILRYLISHYERVNNSTAREIVSTAKRMFKPKSGSAAYKRLLDRLIVFLDRDTRAQVRSDGNDLLKTCRQVLVKQDQLMGGTTLSSQLKLRDRFMAENMISFLDLHASEKAMFAAHSFHTMKKNGFLQGIWTIKPCGAHLEAKYHEQYVAIYVDFAYGDAFAYNVDNQSMQASAIPLNKGTLSQLLYKQQRAPFFANLRTQSEETRKILRVALPFNSIGSVYKGPGKTTDRLSLIDGYDGYIYLPKISPATRRPRSHRIN